MPSCKIVRSDKNMHINPETYLVWHISKWTVNWCIRGLLVTQNGDNYSQRLDELSSATISLSAFSASGILQRFQQFPIHLCLSPSFPLAFISPVPCHSCRGLPRAQSADTWESIESEHVCVSTIEPAVLRWEAQTTSAGQQTAFLHRS